MIPKKKHLNTIRTVMYTVKLMYSIIHNIFQSIESKTCELKFLLRKYSSKFLTGIDIHTVVPTFRQ